MAYPRLLHNFLLAKKHSAKKRSPISPTTEFSPESKHLSSPIHNFLLVKKHNAKRSPISPTTEFSPESKHLPLPTSPIKDLFSHRNNHHSLSMRLKEKIGSLGQFNKPDSNFSLVFIEMFQLLQTSILTSNTTPVIESKQEHYKELKTTKERVGILVVSNRSKNFRGKENIDKIMEKAYRSPFKKIIITDPSPYCHRSILDEEVAIVALDAAVTLTTAPLLHENVADREIIIRDLQLEIKKLQQEAIKVAKEKGKDNARHMSARFKDRFSEIEPEKIVIATPLNEKELFDAQNKYILVTQLEKPHLWKKLETQAEKEAEKRAGILLEFMGDMLKELKENYSVSLRELLTKTESIKKNLAKLLKESVLSHYVEDHAWMIAMWNKFGGHVLYPLKLAETETLAGILQEGFGIVFEDTSKWLTPSPSPPRKTNAPPFLLPPAAPRLLG